VLVLLGVGFQGCSSLCRRAIHVTEHRQRCHLPRRLGALPCLPIRRCSPAVVLVRPCLFVPQMTCPAGKLCAGGSRRRRGEGVWDFLSTLFSWFTADSRSHDAQTAGSWPKSALDPSPRGPLRKLIVFFVYPSSLGSKGQPPNCSRMRRSSRCFLCKNICDYANSLSV
jgi:hypothetical protein